MALSVHSQTMEQAWKECARIEKQIKETSFPDRSFLITDFGARKNTPYEPCHEAINQAILSCCLSGGGRVVVPAGEFYVGPIILKSNVNLHLEKGAKLKFIPKQSLYFPAVLTRWEGIDCYNAHPLIYANGETNIAITGKGVIDGQASNETWWHMSGHPRFGWKEGMTSQKKGGRDRLFHLAENFEPVYKRKMTPQDGLRPQLVNLNNCDRILIEDVTLTNSPFWIIHPVFCENLIVRRARMVSRGPNTDGCDPESTKNVLIEGCYFDTGDDCIAIKSGRNADGRKWNIPSENIIVRNCHMKDGHGGVVVGSEISGGFKNLFIENCTMDSPEQDRAIRIKSNTCRGGIVENIYARNIKVGECKDAILRINLKYESDENCNRAYDPIVKNVYIENVTSQKSKYGVFIDGLDDRINIYNVNLDNCRFENVKNGNYLYKCKDVRFNNLFVNGEQIKD
ncbi:glycoside hydrolase family 28 protein [Bacteroides cellulosilyticus]|uniref:glycoside hydrolase family 28 protein n=2 Tax=Bacteroides TaxID=816 RepID=UPI003977A838